MFPTRSNTTSRLRALSTPPQSRIAVERTNVVGVLRNPKPQRTKSNRRTRYVDLESPARPRANSPLTIQIEDVESTSTMLVSPSGKSRKKKAKRSAKRKQLDKQLDNAREHIHQTPIRTKSTSTTETAHTPAKKLRVSLDAEQKDALRAPSPVILAATPSGDDVLMLKGHALAKQDAIDHMELPSREILLLRGDGPIPESKQHRVRHHITAPLPKLYSNDAPPLHSQTLKSSMSKGDRSTKPPRRLQNRALAPISESKIHLKSKRRSSLRDKFASAKEMGAQIDGAMTVTPDNQPEARGFVPSMPSMPIMPRRSQNKRVSLIRQKFVAAKALGRSTIHISGSVGCAKSLRVNLVTKERLTSGWVR